MTETDIVSIIVPAFNEERSIGSVIDEIPSRLDGWDVNVIVVDDGSTDATAQRAKSHGATVISHSTNRGYGATLKTGFRNANGDVIGFLDADATYPPSQFQALFRELRETDAQIVVGSRLAGRNEGMPPVRRVGNRFFGKVLKAATGTPVTDPASGMRLFSREILDELYDLSDGLDFTPDMTTRLVRRYEYAEVPIPYRERVGDSKLGVVKHGIQFFDTIITAIIDQRPKRLLAGLGLFGALLAAVGYLLVREEETDARSRGRSEVNREPQPGFKSE